MAVAPSNCPVSRADGGGACPSAFVPGPSGARALNGGSGLPGSLTASARSPPADPVTAESPLIADRLIRPIRRASAPKSLLPVPAPRSARSKEPVRAPPGQPIPTADLPVPDSAAAPRLPGQPTPGPVVVIRRVTSFAHGSRDQPRSGRLGYHQPKADGYGGPPDVPLNRSRVSTASACRRPSRSSNERSTTAPPASSGT
jgi:hypothetical protein